MSARSLQAWARKLYNKNYLDLTDEEAKGVYDAREEAENGQEREPQSVTSDGSSPSQNLPQ